MVVRPRLRSTLWGAMWTYLGANASAWCPRTACLWTASASTPAFRLRLRPCLRSRPHPRVVYPVFCSNMDGSQRWCINANRASRAGAQQLEAGVGIGNANARWCFGYGRATVAYWCRCKQLKFTWYSNLIRKELNSIRRGCPNINWGVSEYQLGGVPLPLPNNKYLPILIYY